MAKQRSNFLKIPAYKGAGIYAIMNREKMSVYIGQTTDINARAKQHDEQLTSKTHVNKALQQDADNGTKLNFIVLQRLPEDTKENEFFAALRYPSALFITYFPFETDAISKTTALDKSLNSTALGV